MAMKDEDSERGERLRNQAGWEARREANLRIVIQNTVLGQIWLHNGVRHVQIRRCFEDVLDAETENHFESWEDFLKRVHPRSPLGTSWWVSTKAIFAITQLGFGLVTLLNAIQSDSSPGPGIALIVVGAIFGVITILPLGHPPLPTDDSAGASPATSDAENPELER